jgi:hypothetical protein
MLEISIDSAHFDALEGVVRELNAALERELRAANLQIGAKLNAEAKRLLSDEVYGVPIPLTKAANRGTKTQKALSAKTKARIFNTSTQRLKGQTIRKWRRSSDLLHGEKWAVLPEVGRFSIVLLNHTAYASPRNALGGPNPPNKAGRKAGIQRPQPKTPDAEKSKTRPIMWQLKAVEQNQGWIRLQYEGAIEKALGRKI